MQETIEQQAEHLLLQHYQKYYRLAYLYLRSEEDALDAVQESAYKVIRGCRNIRQSEFLETWITRIVINTATDMLRSRSRTAVMDLTEEEWAAPHEDTYRDLDLEAALKQLEEPDKTIVILRFFEDQKLEDIARITEIGVNTVKTRLYRALKKLRITLEA